MKYIKYLLGLSLLLTTPLAIASAQEFFDDPTFLGTFFEFLYEGIRHIIPLGLDHILFIITIFLLSRSLRQIVKYSLIFTLAHSITLIMVVLGVFVAPGNIIEPIIALSILILAIDLIRPFIATKVQGLIIFIFGLFHGMGFAGVLTELGLPDTQLISALLGFNIGVEVGQVLVIIFMWLITFSVFKDEKMRKDITRGGAVLIGLIALLWVIERTLF